MFKRKLSLCLTLSLLVVVSAAPRRTTAQEASLPELIRRVKPSVVSVITLNENGEILMTGSGFFIRPGEVVTNLHVVAGGHRVEVRTFDGKGKTYAVAGLLDVDAEGDLALLSIDIAPERSRTLDLATDGVPEEGEKIFVIGNPLRLEGTVSDGIVSAVREVPNLGKIIQITAPISQGNSGSPVFNMKGQVVGVVTIKVTNGQNINLAIASARVGELGGSGGEGKLMSFAELSARSNRQTQRPEAQSDWLYRNGLTSLWLGNYEGALAYFENAVGKNPGRVEAWIQVGFCKVKQGKTNEAIKAYERALRLRPNSVEAHNKLGDAFYYAGSYQQAIVAYQQAARLDPRMAEVLYNLGMTYLELGDRAAAVAQSAALKPLDAALYNKLLGEIER